MKIKISIFLFVIILTACTSCLQNRDRTNNEQTEEEIVEENNSKTIVLQPFEGLDCFIIDSLASRLSKVVPELKVNKSIPLPQSAYYAERNRYKADSITRYLWKLSTAETIVMGVTDKDISVANGKNKDWGIIGYATSVPSHACVISTYRLSRENLIEQLYKGIIHELGHAEGLYHCSRSDSCLMRSFEGKNMTNQLTSFCHFCKFHLTERGWKLD